jgi:hypothetical protein
VNGISNRQGGGEKCIQNFISQRGPRGKPMCGMKDSTKRCLKEMWCSGKNNESPYPSYLLSDF